MVYHLASAVFLSSSMFASFPFFSSLGQSYSYVISCSILSTPFLRWVWEEQGGTPKEQFLNLLFLSCIFSFGNFSFYVNFILSLVFLSNSFDFTSSLLMT